jgi:hypothetical protein
MRKLSGLLGAGVLLGTIGVGAVSADPINDNSRYIYGANCDGELVDLVTNMGASAHDLDSSRTFVLMGATIDGVWTLPLAEPGQAKKDLSTCSYTAHDHAIVIYGKWKADA